MTNIISGDRVDYLRLNEILLAQGYFNDPVNKRIYISAKRAFTEINLEKALSTLPEAKIKAKIDPYGMRSYLTALKNGDKFQCAVNSDEWHFEEWDEAVFQYNNASKFINYKVTEIKAKPLEITVNALDEILSKEGWFVLAKTIIYGDYVEEETVYLKRSEDYDELRKRLVRIFSSDKYSSFVAHLELTDAEDDEADPRWIIYKKDDTLKIVEFEDGLSGNHTLEQKEASEIFFKELLPRLNVELR